MGVAPKNMNGHAHLAARRTILETDRELSFIYINTKKENESKTNTRSLLVC